MSSKPYCKKKPCKNCPYRIDAPLRHWSVEEFKDLIKNSNEQFGAVYSCHKKDGTVCTGFVLDQLDNNIPSIMLRISFSRNNVTGKFLDSLTCPVERYKSIQEMSMANYPEYFKTVFEHDKETT